MSRPIGSNTRRNQILLALVGLIILLCCGGVVYGFATSFQPSGSENPVCIGGISTDDGCEYPEGDDD